jgi:hypothetical protein
LAKPLNIGVKVKLHAEAFTDKLAKLLDGSRRMGVGVGTTILRKGGEEQYANSTADKG